MCQSLKFAVLTRSITCFFMVRWVSSVTLRALTDWENMTFAVPTVRESGMGKDVDILWGDTIIASVLSSFSFSLLLDIHTLTSWMHSCIDCTSSPIWCGGADFLSCLLSANEWWWIEWCSVTSERGVALRNTARNSSRIRLLSCWWRQFESYWTGMRRIIAVKYRVYQKHTQDV